MSLQKGFLRPKITLDTLNLSKRKLILGCLWWAALTFCIYAFMYGIRELFRYTSYWYNYEDFLVLTALENYFYNFVFACFAGIFAFSAISNHWLRRPLTLGNLESYRKAAIFHDKTSYSWYFTYWFSKLSVLFAVQSCFMGVFTDFSLFPDYAIILMLMVLSLFFHEWLTLRRVFKNAVIPWMVAVFGLIVTTAGIFSFINIIPSKQLNESVLINTVSYHLSLDLPELKSARTYGRRSLLTDIYLGFPKTKSDSIPQLAVKYFSSPYSEISLSQIEEFINEQKSMVDEFERNQLVWRLNIDKRVKMKYVKELMNELYRNNARSVQFASSDKESNGLVGNQGSLRNLFPILSNEEVVYEDEGELVIMPIRFAANKILVSDHQIGLRDVKEIIGNFFKKNGNGILELSIDDVSTFEVYIGVYDDFRSAIWDLRNDWAMKNFGVPYTGFESYDSAQQQIDKLALEQYQSYLYEIDD